MADGDDPPPSKQRLTATMIGLAVGGLVVPTVAIAVAYRSCQGTTVRGTVAVRGAGADWQARLAGCAAEADGRTVALDGGGDPLVRATLDPIDGPRLELAVTGTPPVVLTAATCTGLAVTQRPRGKRADGSAILDGSFAVACAVPAGHPLAGAHVSGDGWWHGCALPDGP